MLDTLLKWDRWLFEALNSGFSHPWLDKSMPILTDLHKEPNFIYMLLPLILVWLYKTRIEGMKVILGLILLIACTDSFNGKVLKPYFARERPPAVESNIEVRTKRFAGLSFPSNHAANNFAGATFLAMVYPGAGFIFYAIALFVGYSRIYVGVHYPADILVGGLWASLFAIGFYHLWRLTLSYYIRKD